FGRGAMGLYTAVGIVAVVAPFFLFPDSLTTAIGFSCFFLIGSGVVIYSTKRYGLISWSSGIAWYYVLLFFVLPLLEQAVGIRDYSESRGIATSLIFASFGLFAFA